MTRYHASLTLALALLFSPAAHAAVLFSETFDDANEAAVGNAPLRDAGTTYDRAERFTVQNTVGAFGSNYGRFDDYAGSDDAGWEGINDLPGIDESLITVSFRFYEPDDVGDLANRNGGIIFFTGPTGNSGQARTNISFNGGSLNVSGQTNAVAGISYAEDVVHTIQIVINDSDTDTASYDSIARTLAPNSYEVWLNGSLVAGAVGFVAETQVLDSFVWDTFTGDRQTFLIDDFVVETGATPIPEPASLALLGLGGLCLLSGRHR